MTKTSREADLQRELLGMLAARMDTGGDTQHILAGDFNCSLLGRYLQGYALDSQCRRADRMFEDFVNIPRLHRRWWLGQITEGLWTRRNPAKFQRSRIDEILVLGTEVSPSAQMHREGKSYYMHTVDHGDS